MTKRDLLKQLADVPDDTQIRVAFDGAANESSEIYCLFKPDGLDEHAALIIGGFKHRQELYSEPEPEPKTETETDSGHCGREGCETCV